MENQAVITLMQELKFPIEGIETCIETGTHRGWGTEAFSKYFKQVYTIELSQELFDYCKQTYNLPNVEFLQGHSPAWLKTLSNKITGKYILFLDAHGSGGDTTFHESVGRMGSPALEEILACISNPPEYIILDDLSDFDQIPSYPKRDQIIDAVSTIGTYENYIIPKYKGWFVFKRKHINKTCIIQQPGGLGDIFFCQKIAKRAVQKYEWNVIWPILSAYKYINEYLNDPKITYCTLDDLPKINVGETITFPLQHASRRLGTPDDILQSKYKLIGISSKDWADWFVFKRNMDRENELFYNKLKLKDGEEYAFVNKNFASPPNVERINNILPIDKKLKIVEMQFFPDDRLFDWCKVLENASEIHTVQTSLNYLAEKLTLKAGKNKWIYQRPGWTNYDYIKGIFKQEWILV